MKVREVFNMFAPYEWEISPREIAAIAGIPVERVLRLDTNTSPFPPKKWLRKLAKKLVSVPVNQYPDTKYFEITEAITKYVKVELDNIVMTNGADEAIDIIVKTLLDCGDKIILSVPSYPMFRIASEIAGAKVLEVDRKSEPPFMDDVDEIIHVGKKEKVSAVFLSNPNNPTGTLMEVDDIRRLAEEIKCGVIVDEAYFEYCGKSAVKLIKEYENVVIIRTLSKAFSLAGERIGYILADQKTVDKFNYVRPPNSLSVTSIELAMIALSDIKQVRKLVNEVIIERDRCFNFLKSISNITPYPSTANFILFTLSDISAEYVHGELLKRGISVRNLSGTRNLKNCLRVTIGSRNDNDRFLQELTTIIKSNRKNNI